MKEIKKASLIIFFLLLSCGYKPIYSSKNMNFSIKEIQNENTPLNNEFARNLKAFQIRKLQIKSKLILIVKKKLRLNLKIQKETQIFMN